MRRTFEDWAAHEPPEGHRVELVEVVSSGDPATIRITDDIVVELDVDTLFAPRRQPGTVGA
jgi:hypothetical protein